MEKEDDGMGNQSMICYDNSIYRVTNSDLKKATVLTRALGNPFLSQNCKVRMKTKASE